MFDQEELCVVAQTSGTEELCEAHVVSFFFWWVGGATFFRLRCEFGRRDKMKRKSGVNCNECDHVNSKATTSMAPPLLDFPDICEDSIVIRRRKYYSFCCIRDLDFPFYAPLCV